MSNWWILLIVVVVAAGGYVYYRSRRNGRSGQSSASHAGTQPDRDYAQEREESRRSYMSEEDKSWEAASLQRNREAQERNPPPPSKS